MSSNENLFFLFFISLKKLNLYLRSYKTHVEFKSIHPDIQFDMYPFNLDKTDNYPDNIRISIIYLDIRKYPSDIWDIKSNLSQSYSAGQNFHKL